MAKKIIIIFLLLQTFFLYSNRLGVLTQATSVLIENRDDPMRYSSTNLLDRNLATCWVEGVDGKGVGQSVGFLLEAPRQMSGIRMVTGFAKNPTIWQQNSRPSQIDILIVIKNSTMTYTYTWDLKDEMQEQQFDFPDGLLDHVFCINLTITKVYSGTKFEDSCISEISFISGKRDIAVKGFAFNPKVCKPPKDIVQFSGEDFYPMAVGLSRSIWLWGSKSGFKGQVSGYQVTHVDFADDCSDIILDTLDEYYGIKQIKEGVKKCALLDFFEGRSAFKGVIYEMDNGAIIKPDSSMLLPSKIEIGKTYQTDNTHQIKIIGWKTIEYFYAQDIRVLHLQKFDKKNKLISDSFWALEYGCIMEEYHLIGETYYFVP